MSYIGDFPEDFASVPVFFSTHDGNGAPVAPSSAFETADVLIYKNGDAAQKTSTNGLTMTSPFDSVTGLHRLLIDTSNDTGDGGFWVKGATYTVILSPDETVNGQTVLKVLGTFSLDINNVSAIKAKTDNLPSDPADASVIAGRFDTLDTSVADLPTNAELATALGTADDVVLTAIDALPTNAELATALGTADDAVLAAISAVSTKVDTVDTVVDAIKVKTDSLTFTVANKVDSNIKSVADTTVTGAGTEGDPWGP